MIPRDAWALIWRPASGRGSRRIFPESTRYLDWGGLAHQSLAPRAAFDFSDFRHGNRFPSSLMTILYSERQWIGTLRLVGGVGFDRARLD